MRVRSLLLAASSAAALAAPALAQDGPHDHGEAPVSELVVTALPLDRRGHEVASSVTVLSGDALTTRRQATLGETLNGVPGVNSDTFGGGASRPVIRGQTAPRVKVLSSGSALMDASEVSPDHAVSAEPLLLDGIEILRGPSALLYGGGAIGGAVNLVDKKIPTRNPAKGGEGVLEIRGGTADDEGAAVASLTAGRGAFAVHVEAAGRRASDYKIPDFDADRLAGSQVESQSAALGVSWIDPQGYLGVAYSEQASRYGLPGHNHEFESCHPHGLTLHCGDHDDGDGHDHSHDGEAAEAPPQVDMLSRRVDLRGEWRNPTAGVDRIRLRAGYTDYAHEEIDEGVVGATFTNEGFDTRLEVQHAPIAGLRGVVGGQVSRNDFAAIGDESFLPLSRTKSAALFLLEEMTFGRLRIEGALRQEWLDASAEDRTAVSYRPLSASLAGVWSFTPTLSAQLSVSRSQRAPTAQELYARGVHLATNAYEIGSTALTKETAYSVELSLRKTGGPTTFSASAYRYDYDGYVFANTLDQFEDFRLIQYAQADAVFTGVEGEARHEVIQGLGLGVFGDYVRAKLKNDGGSLPRIPAARLGARGDFTRDRWSANLEYYRAFDQDKVAAFERATPGYDMVNATLAYSFDLRGADSEIYVRGTNLLNDLALNHASFLAEVAPLRGRKVALGVRTRF
ncbi:TonB-dependent receptor domain-containing protein [Phenylobacterium immobile]|uniref:TonB-dependent receptor domain-containing protein n=1 Tax=Phenylobacterium immobile TaxID=21 RepID=UPI000B05FF76|nr:TonB-dependent receptor [Phenylobacterium immobile]